MAKKTTNFFLNVIIFLVTIIICLSVGEIFVRIFIDEVTPGSLPQENAVFVPGLRQNVYVNLKNITVSTSEFSFKLSTNDKGFRNFNPLEKPKDSLRIVGLGSSSIFGNTVNSEDTYLKKLESKINIPGLDVETINLGLPNSGFDEMKYILKEYAFDYNPDLIIIDAAPGNFFAAVQFSKRIDKTGDNSLFALIYRNSKLFNYLYWKVKTTPLGNKMVNLLKLNKNGQSSNNFAADFIQGKNTENIHLSEKNTYQNLKEIKDLADEKGVPILVVFMPPSYQIKAEKLKDIISRYNLNEDSVDVTIAERFFKIVTGRLNIPFFDPTADMINDPRSDNWYWKFDGHLNKEGNEAYSSLLADFIQKSDLIKNGN